jgi:hypothetical protein
MQEQQYSILSETLQELVDSCFAAVAAAFGDFTAAEMVHKVKP